jgi:hypothetical protein
MSDKDARQRRPRYEFMTLEMKAPQADGSWEEMNRLGAEGWRIRHFERDTSARSRVVLEREVIRESEG